jgi:hypothetical protein
VWNLDAWEIKMLTWYLCRPSLSTWLIWFLMSQHLSHLRRIPSMWLFHWLSLLILPQSKES